jgi:hypothetical protein
VVLASPDIQAGFQRSMELGRGCEEWRGMSSDVVPRPRRTCHQFVNKVFV